jgi:hypothetical protein
VGSGATVIVGEIDNATRAGLLTIQGGAKLTVAGGATLAVTAASHVIVNKTGAGGNALADSGLSLLKGANVIAVVANTLGANQALIDLVAENGSAGNTLVAIETGAPAIIDAGAVFEEITTSGATGGGGGTRPVDVEDEVTDIAEASPARSTGTAADALSFLNTPDTPGNNVTTVIYTGPTALGPITATGKALIIAGTITGQSAAIAVGTLEIAEGGKLETTETITADTVTNNGTLTLSGSSVESEVAESLTNNGLLTVSGTATLEVAAEAKLTVASGAKVEVEGPSGILDLSALSAGTNKVTLSGSGSQIEVSGTLKLPAPSTTEDGTKYEVAQINYGTSSIKINAGGKVYMVSTDDPPSPPAEDYYIGPADPPGAKYTWGTGTPSVEFKAAGEMVLTGNLTSSADNAINTKVTINEHAKLTVAEGTTLTVGSTGNLVVENNAEVIVKGDGGVLDLSTIPDIKTGAVTISGLIEVSGTLKAPATDGSGKTPQIEYADDGAIKLKKGSEASIGGQPYIGTQALYKWEDVQTGITDPHILLKQDNITLNANLLTLAHNSINDTATIAKGATLTIGNGLRLAIDVEGTVNVYGTLKLMGYGTDAPDNVSSRVTLAGPDSKLVVHPQGTIDATTAANSLIHGSNSRDETTVEVTVSATAGGPATKATAADSNTTGPNHGWTLTSTSAATSPAINMVIGQFKLAVNADTVVSAAPGATANEDGAIASLTAADGTYITFKGTTL